MRGDGHFDSETLVAWEIGSRFNLRENLSIDVTAFYNEYDKLRSFEPQAPEVSFTPVPHVTMASVIGNGLAGDTVGAEVSIMWQPRRSWNLQASYATIEFDLQNQSTSFDQSTAREISSATPDHELKLVSQFQLNQHWQFDTFVRYQTELQNGLIPAYLGLNIRIGWHPSSAWEFELIGQDLLQASHPEYPVSFVTRDLQEVPRAVQFKTTYRF